MDLKGKIENLYRDFKTGKWNLLIGLNEYPSEEMNDLIDQMVFKSKIPIVQVL